MEVKFQGRRLGKRAPRRDLRTLQLRDYINKVVAPTPPPEVSWITKVSAAETWGMLANDTLGCHDAKTEVLTARGWTPWPDYDGKTSLGTMNPLTGSLEFQVPTALIRYDYKGELLHGNHKSLDFALTPNHRMFYRRYVIPRGGTPGYLPVPEFKRIDQLPTRVAIPAATTGFPSGTHLEYLRIGRHYWRGDDLIALLSVVLSDGWVGGTDNTKNRVSFCCFREDRREMVAELAHRLSIGEQPGRRGVWQFSDPDLAQWIRDNSYESGTKAVHRHVPEIIKFASQEQISRFLDFYGDQHVSQSRQFYSSSPRMIDDLQELLLRIGKRGGISQHPIRQGGQNSAGRRITGNVPSYTLTERRTKEELSITKLSRLDQIQSGDYNGEVFCAEVPNSTLITRRNGKILISGNCCVEAAQLHSIQQMKYYSSAMMVTPTDADAIRLYTQEGGYIVGQPNTDNGTDMVTALNYWKNTGARVGNVLHQIAGYVQVDPANAIEVQTAIWLFGSLFTGLQLPLSAQTQTTWTVPQGGAYGNGSPGSWGGHCVPIFARSPESATCITWGSVLKMSHNFFSNYVDECFAVLAPDWISTVTALSPGGLDLAQLQADLASLAPNK